MAVDELNVLLTQTGRGTPCGELMRRYWQPVALAEELPPGGAPLPVRLLGEDLVLFRDKQGRVGLLADHCAHRGASLCYGRVEERGISCAYHGWLYDTGGNVLETPPERNDAILKHVQQPAYPVQKFVGLYWAYFGPQPAPVIAPYDVWLRTDGIRRLYVQPRLDCNWFQAMENSVDSAHLQILHQEFIGDGRRPANTTRGFTDDVQDTDFFVGPIGIVKRRTYVDGKTDEHPLIFPNILRQANCTQIRVPIDDTHTRIFFVRFFPTEDGSQVHDQSDPPVEHLAPYKDPPDALHPHTRFRWEGVQYQDHAMWSCASTEHRL